MSENVEEKLENIVITIELDTEDRISITSNIGAEGTARLLYEAMNKIMQDVVKKQDKEEKETETETH